MIIIFGIGIMGLYMGEDNSYFFRIKIIMAMNIIIIIIIIRGNRDYEVMQGSRGLWFFIWYEDNYDYEHYHYHYQSGGTGIVGFWRKKIILIFWYSGTWTLSLSGGTGIMVFSMEEDNSDFFEDEDNYDNYLWNRDYGVMHGRR